MFMFIHFTVYSVYITFLVIYLKPINNAIEYILSLVSAVIP